MTRVNNVTDFNFGSFGLQSTANAIRNKSNPTNQNSGDKSNLKTYKRSLSEKKTFNRMNSKGKVLKTLIEDSDKESSTNDAQVKEDDTRVKKLQNILKLKRKSTVDNFNFRSNLLLVPGVVKSQQNQDSQAGVTVSSQADMLSALGIRNEIRKHSQRMQSIILCSPTLNKRDGPRNSVYTVSGFLNFCNF